MYRIFLNFAKSYILSCISECDIKKKFRNMTLFENRLTLIQD